MIDTTGGACRSVVPRVVAMILLAAGAADGLDLVISGRDADWPLLIRADLELLGGFWLLSGRSSRRARIAAIAAWGGIVAFDLARAAAGYPARHVFGRIVVGHWCVLFSDAVILAGLLLWRPVSERPARWSSDGRRLAAAFVLAVALGLAIERSQVGQFPIVATVRAGRSSSGLDYLVYLPDGYYRSRGRWPLILTLHGRGEASDDIGMVRSQGLPRRVEAKGGLPFVIVAPQSPGWSWDVGALSTLLDEVLGRYRVDPDRLYVVGNSMGGTGTWLLAAHSPGRFAAIAPICGGADPASAGRLKDVPSWAFHGAADRIVALEQSERMIEALKKVGGDARLTVYPGVGHDAWTPTYADPRFYDWLLQHRRPPRRSGDEGTPR
jgi:dienelactone hydrolase